MIFKKEQNREFLTFEMRAGRYLEYMFATFKHITKPFSSKPKFDYVSDVYSRENGSSTLIHTLFIHHGIGNHEIGRLEYEILGADKISEIEEYSLFKRIGNDYILKTGIIQIMNIFEKIHKYLENAKLASCKGLCYFSFEWVEGIGEGRKIYTTQLDRVFEKGRSGYNDFAQYHRAIARIIDLTQK